MSTIRAIGAGWVSRASGLRSPTVSDHEQDWGHWGRVSDHEQNWGHRGGLGVTHFPLVSEPLGPGGSPIMNAIRAIGAGWVSRASGLWFFMVSDHEQLGPSGPGGVTRFGPVVWHGLRS